LLAGGGGGAQCAYPVLAAVPRRMGTAVSQCAVALRRTAAGPAGGLRTKAHEGGAGGWRPAVAGEGVRAGAPWTASGRRTGVGVRSVRVRASLRRRRGHSRPCCRGPEAGRGEHKGKRPRAAWRAAAGRVAARRADARTDQHHRARTALRDERRRLPERKSPAQTAVGPRQDRCPPARSQRPARAGVCRKGARPPDQSRAHKATKQRLALLDRPLEQDMIHARKRRRHHGTLRTSLITVADIPSRFTPQHAPKCSCMRLSTARPHFPCSPCARLRFPGSRCVHLL
jgi:hypothetical protein